MPYKDPEEYKAGQKRSRQKHQARDQAYRDAHKEEHKLYAQAHRLKMLDNDPDYEKKAHFRKRYGITMEERDVMIAKQDGKCACCYKRRKLVVDHCHRTNKLRQMLCYACNSFLGTIDDNKFILFSMIEYLGRHTDTLHNELKWADFTASC